jgi:tricarballylate dehydrogenase
VVVHLACDVAVVGSGNAALCAALAAAGEGARVVVLEAGPEEHFGGNTRYTAGAMRFAYRDRAALEPLLVGCRDLRLPDTDFGAYPETEFAADLARYGEGALPDLQRELVERSHDALRWLVAQGLRLEPIYARQSFRSGGRHVFWGGLVLAARGEGEGLVAALRAIATERSVAVRLGQRAVALETEGGAVRGVRIASGERVTARSVVLACGGFEADPALRARHLGAEWHSAVVRGTPLNRGDGLRMAGEIGAATRGNFAGCHAVCMDVATPVFDACEIPHVERKNFRKISYAFGVMLNARGERFVDEGADFRNYTYAQYGREVLRQPGGFAWQIFDAQVEPLLYEEYRVPGATRVEAVALEDLVAKLDGVEPVRALATLRAFNAAIDASRSFDPAARDGRGTRGITPPKTNWALALEQPPFRGFRVTCGITFTYGGLAIRASDAAVLDATGAPIAGLYAAGEIVGGVFADGYPGGSGLTAGAVFGRKAGRSAAQSAR